jgi:hypothetical protein
MTLVFASMHSVADSTTATAGSACVDYYAVPFLFLCVVSIAISLTVMLKIVPYALKVHEMIRVELPITCDPLICT